jgi:MFS family permease
VTNYPALIFLSIGDTLGFAGFLAINVVYMSEIMGPTWRRKVMLPSQAVCIFLLYVVVGGILPHYWFPVHYRYFLWFLTIVNVLVAIYLVFRMPESPRWLEAADAPSRPARSWSGWRHGSGDAIRTCPSQTCSLMKWRSSRRLPGGHRSASST